MNRAYTSPVDKLEKSDLEFLLKLALEEDAPSGDITSESIFSPQETCRAGLVAREGGILCGSAVLPILQELTGNHFHYELLQQDTALLQAGETIAVLDGSLISILRVERPLLNMMQYLSGIATATEKIVSRYPGLRILDTRKTIPGYRKLVKYAVHCGGGWNHRLNLSDMAMLKDNHIAHSRSIRNAVGKIREKSAVKIEVEIDRLDQLDDAIASGAEIILLDNFSLEDIKRAVPILRNANPDIMIEVSGGMTPEKLEGLAGMAGLGVSMGYLTHTTRFLDFSLELS